MVDMAGALRRHSEALANLASQEMGKPIVQARAEIGTCAALSIWCAEYGTAFLANEAAGEGPNAYVSYLTIGAALGVAPWNFPLWHLTGPG